MDPTKSAATGTGAITVTISAATGTGAAG